MNWLRLLGAVHNMHKYSVNISFIIVNTDYHNKGPNVKLFYFEPTLSDICYICHRVNVSCSVMVISYNLTEKSSILSFTINLMQVNVNTCTVPAFFFLIIVKYIEYDTYEHISMRYILFNSMSWLSSPIFILFFSPKSLSYLVATLFMHIDLTSQKSIAKKNNAFLL